MKRFRFLSALLIVVVLGSFCLTGCGQQAKAPQNAQDKAKTITVADGTGREVTVSGEVKRVITNYGIASHMVFALGAHDRLVGIDSPSQNNTFFNSLKPETAKMASPGSPKEFNMEEAIALKPDLVLVPGRNTELIENLEAKGLTVFGVVAEDLEQLKTTMINLSKLLGEEEKGQEFAEYYDDTLSLVGKHTAGLSDQDKPTVYLVGPMGFLSTCSFDMYQNYLIDLAGGKNAAAGLKGGWVEVSPEQVINWDPDIILVVRYTSGISPEEILADSRWQGIKAVKNKQVFWFPSEINPWDYPSPQAALGIKWLAQKLHPDKFTYNMQDEADSFFNTLYGKSFTELGGKL